MRRNGLYNQLLSRLLTVLYYAYVFLFLLALPFPCCWWCILPSRQHQLDST